MVRNSSADTAVVSFAATPAVGNHVLVLCSEYLPAGDTIDATCTDNQGNTYTRIGYSPLLAAWGGNYFSQAFIAPISTASGTFTVTVDQNGASSYYTVGIFEISGVDATTPTEGATSQTTTSPATNFDIDLAVTTVPDCLGVIVVAGGIPSADTDGLIEDINWVQHADVYNFDNWNYMGLYVLTRSCPTSGGNYDFDGEWSFGTDTYSGATAFFIRGAQAPVGTPAMLWFGPA